MFHVITHMQIETVSADRMSDRVRKKRNDKKRNRTIHNSDEILMVDFHHQYDCVSNCLNENDQY